MFDTKQMTEMAEKISELYKNTGLKPEAFTEAFEKMSAMTPSMPKVNFNKNGYEIRTQVLEMAQGNVWNVEYANQNVQQKLSFQIHLRCLHRGCLILILSTEKSGLLS